MPHYRVTAVTPASAEIVWRLLVDARSWPRWASGLDEIVENRCRGLDPDGNDPVGAVRAFRSGRTVTTEQLIALVPQQQMTYAGLSNPALKHYRATIQLEPGPGATIISWHGTWRPKPGLGWLMRFVLPRVMQQMADDLAAHAAERA